MLEDVKITKSVVDDDRGLLESIDRKLSYLIELLQRYQPLLDQAEKRLKPKFGGGRARG